IFADLRPAKIEALLDVIKARDEACVVFTEFRATQREIVRALSDEGYPVHTFHGGLSAQEKERVIHGFRSEGGVLVSTESGGEGRNLQFCRTVINYDLPWNP